MSPEELGCFAACTGGDTWEWIAGADTIRLPSGDSSLLAWLERLDQPGRAPFLDALRHFARNPGSTWRAEVRLDGQPRLRTMSSLRDATHAVRVIGVDTPVPHPAPPHHPPTPDAHREFLDAAPAMIWTSDPRGNARFFNTSWRRFTGTPLEHAEGDAWRHAVHPDDRAAWSDTLAAAAAVPRPFTREYRLRTADGSYAWVLDTASPTFDPAGRHDGFIGWCVDISHRREEQDRLALAIEASPTALIMVNHAGRIVLVNAQAERLFGYAREELIDATIEMLVPAPFRHAHPADRNAFFADPRTRPMGAGRDLYGQRKDGTMVPVEIGLSPIDTGRGVYVLSSVVDISQRKRTEQALRDSQARLAGVIDSAMDAIITIDASQKIVLFNAAAERMFRCRADEALGRPLDRFIPERSRHGHRRHIEGFGRTGTTSRRMGALGELNAVRADAEEFPIEASISQIVAGGERLFTVILRDITERVRAEAALRESEERYRAVSELTSDFAYALRFDPGLEPVLEWATDAFVIITGYTPEELERLGGWRAIILPEDAAIFEQQLAAVTDGRTETAEFRLLTRSGHIRWIRNRARPVPDPDARVSRALGAAHDVTDRRDAERRQQIMMAELDHRVKNNLALVLSIAAQTSQSARSISQFNESFAGRIHALARVHSTLALARWKGANLRQLVLENLQIHAGDHPERISAEGDDVVLPAWQAQPLGLVLHELATNAVKYGALSTPSGRVSVRWSHAAAPNGAPLLRILWQESHGPAVTPPRSRGFGTVLIEKGVAYELRGSASLCFNPDGLSCEIITPHTGAAQSRQPGLPAGA